MSTIHRHDGPNFGRRWFRRAESGAVLVETAIVTIVLVVLSFGAIEFGLLLRQTNDVADAVRSGARTAAASSNDPTADYNILQSMKNSNLGLAGDISSVVVYKADSLGRPTSTCASFQVESGKCNVYSGAAFNASGPAGIASSYWSPASRVPGTDYVGVLVKSNHNFITGFFGDSLQFKDQAVVRIEAEALPNPNAGENNGFSNGATVNPPFGTQIPTGRCTVCNGGNSGNGGGGSF